MNLETLNRYVLMAVGLFGVALYLVLVFTGVSGLLSRMPKPKRSRKRIARPRLRNVKKSI